MIQLDYLPSFAFRCKQKFTWHRMEEEKPMADKKEALARKRELGEYKCPTGYRIIKHQNKYFLYEKKD